MRYKAAFRAGPVRAKRGALFLAAALILAACAHAPSPPDATVLFPGAPPLRAEVADTPEERARGLMLRPSLPPGEAMLFVFPEERPWGFWMKDVQFPLDIIWLSANGTVVHVWSAPPCLADPCPTREPPAPALYVVETVAGFAAEHSVGPGTKAEIRGLSP